MLFYLKNEPCSARHGSSVGQHPEGQGGHSPCTLGSNGSSPSLLSRLCKPSPGGAYLLPRHWQWAPCWAWAPHLGTDTFILKLSLCSSFQQTITKWCCPEVRGMSSSTVASGEMLLLLGRSNAGSSSKGQPHCSFCISVVTDPCWTLHAFLFSLFCASSWRHYFKS